MGFDWHRQCLKCEECGKVLNPGQHAEVLLYIADASEFSWSLLNYFHFSTKKIHTAMSLAIQLCSDPNCSGTDPGWNPTRASGKGTSIFAARFSLTLPEHTFSRAGKVMLHQKELVKKVKEYNEHMENNGLQRLLLTTREV